MRLLQGVDVLYLPGPESNRFHETRLIAAANFHRAGYKVVLCHHFVNNINEGWTMSRFLNRHIRWAKLRWKIGGLANYVPEIVFNPVFIAALPLFVQKPSWTMA